MAWTCSGATNEALVQNLWDESLITSSRVRDAMLQVDRGDYAPARPYRDEPQPIGNGATISAPHMHAAACESLIDHLKPGARVLDIGCGSGYLTHVLANLIQAHGLVIGIDHIEQLVDLARVNTSKSEQGRAMLRNGQIAYITGDGRLGHVLGSSEKELYNAIHVGAASKGIPDALITQLKAPGRMFIPVEEEKSHQQHIYVVDKLADGSVIKTRDMGVRYVPLTDAPSSRQ